MDYQTELYFIVLEEVDSSGQQHILMIIWMEVDHQIYLNKLTIKIDTSNGISFIKVTPK